MTRNRVSVAYRGPEWFESWAREAGVPYFDRVTSLHLAGERYDDRVVGRICSLRNLESLSLCGTGISADGLETIRGALPDCEIRSSGSEIPDSLTDLLWSASKPSR